MGAATAFTAASIGMAQPDLKRVVAYSTCSQLGSMLAGCCSIGSCSVQACSSGFWQTLTHGADKAVLFLLAGCLIHFATGEQDVRRFGSMGKRLSLVSASLLVHAGMHPGIKGHGKKQHRELTIAARLYTLAGVAASKGWLVVILQHIGGCVSVLCWQWRARSPAKIDCDNDIMW